MERQFNLGDSCEREINGANGAKGLSDLPPGLLWQCVSRATVLNTVTLA